MKCFLVSLFLVYLGVVDVVQSQVVADKGIKIGLNMSRFYGGEFGMQFHPGVTVGGFYNWNATNRMFVTSELTYSQKGSRHDPQTNLDILTRATTKKVHYLSLPLAVQFKLLSLTRHSVSTVYCGLEPSVKVGASGFDLGPYEHQPGANALTRDKDIGLLFGSSSSFSWNDRLFLVDFRSSVGLLAIDSSGNKNLTLSLMIGYGFQMFESKLTSQ